MEEKTPIEESPKSEKVEASRQKKEKNGAPGVAKINSKKKQTPEGPSRIESTQFTSGHIKGEHESNKHLFLEVIILCAINCSAI